MSSDGTVCVWSLQSGGGGGSGMTLVSRLTCDVLSGASTMLGGALSYHGCFVALAGRRVAQKRGAMTLTFPTGLEGLLTIQPVPNLLTSTESRFALLTRACAYMNAPESAEGRGYGGRESVGTIRWWWDIAYMAREMSLPERQRLLVQLNELKARLLSLAAAPPTLSPKLGNTGGGGGLRLPLHSCVREADESTRCLPPPLPPSSCSFPTWLAAVAEKTAVMKESPLLIGMRVWYAPAGIHRCMCLYYLCVFASVCVCACVCVCEYLCVNVRCACVCL